MTVFAAVSLHLCSFFWISRFSYVLMSHRNFYNPFVFRSCTWATEAAWRPCWNTVRKNYPGGQISPWQIQRNSYYDLIHKEREKRRFVASSCTRICSTIIQKIAQAPNQITHVGFFCKGKPSGRICCRQNNKTQLSRLPAAAAVSLVSKIHHPKVF